MECPVCGCKDGYFDHYKNDKVEARPEYHSCKGCSTIFKHPDKFYK